LPIPFSGYERRTLGHAELLAHFVRKPLDDIELRVVDKRLGGLRHGVGLVHRDGQACHAITTKQVEAMLEFAPVSPDVDTAYTRALRGHYRLEG
jgi:hypothetical protein